MQRAAAVKVIAKARFRRSKNWDFHLRQLRTEIDVMKKMKP